MFSWRRAGILHRRNQHQLYRPPEKKTFARWKALAPPGFIFAVKASRFITHIKRLKDAEDSVKLFFSRAQPLGTALGPVLFQLPPRWKLNLDRLSDFLSILPRRHKFSLEFRDQSWYSPQVYQMLRLHNVALCIHDWREMPWPKELTADFIYIRLHGSGMRWGGNYPDAQLRRWAEAIRSWQPQLKEVFVYFNNDIGGHAIRNAHALRHMLNPAFEPTV